MYYIIQYGLQLHTQDSIASVNKKFELKLTRRAKAYSSSCSQVILVYLHPFHRNSLFCSQKS